MTLFKEKVTQVVRMIPEGKVASYGQVALYAGLPRAAREVGWILRSMQENVPWWRVVNNAGRVSIDGNFHADKRLQKRLLENDGVKVSDEMILDIEKYRWRISEEQVKELQLTNEIIEMVVKKYSL